MRIFEVMKNHKRKLMWLFYGLMAVLVALVASRELSGLNGPEMRQLLSSLSPGAALGFIILGIAAFTATGAYDVFASRHFGVEMPPQTAVKIGWVAQAFNNFAGLGGLTGGTIRSRYYKRAGAEPAKALNVTLCIWAANLVGLFVLLLATLPFAIKYEKGLWVVPLVACLYIPLYFFGGALPSRWLKEHSPLSLQTFPQKLQMTFASLLDWAVAAVFFWWCVRFFVPHADPWMSAFVYSTATLVGLLSFIPAGLGTFDVTCLALFGAVGYNTERLFLAILMYRVTYYLVPWLIAAVYGGWEIIAPKIGLADPRRREDLIISVLWIGILFSGIVLIISAITPDFYERIKFLRDHSPRFVHTATGITSLLIGVMLVILARGIRARVARIYPVCLALLVFGAIAEMAKGLNYEEALVLLLFAVLLFAARSSFINAPLQLTGKSFFLTFLTVIGIPLALFVWRLNNRPKLGNPYPNHGHAVNHVIFYGIVVMGIAVSLLFSRGRRLEFKPPTDDDVARFESFLATYGGNEYSHLFFLGDKQVFYSKDGRVALLYRPDANNLIVLGDPIGCEDGFEDAIDEFVRRAERHGMNVAIYELSARHLATCADQGFTFVKIGEDAMLDLSQYSNVGNKGKIFRRMRNRMGEKGTHFELVEPPFSNDFLADLRAVSDAWLGDRDEMGFSLGLFDVDYLGRTPIAVVRGEDRIEGFASIMPSRDGVASVDLMRIRPDAPGGTMDGIFVSLIEWAKENGYTHYNLGMAPMSNTGYAVYSGAKQKVIRYIYDFGNRAYNFKGLRSYKEKFRPEWTSRYLVYRSASVLVSTLVSVLNIIHRPTSARAIGIEASERHWEERMRQPQGYSTSESESATN